MSTTLQLYLGRDDEFSLQFAAPDGSPYDLTGCSVIVALKLTPGGDELLRLTPGNGVDITAPATGGFVRFTISRAAKVTAGLTDLVAPYWDVLLVDSAGRELVVFDSAQEALGGCVTVRATIANPVA